MTQQSHVGDGMYELVELSIAMNKQYMSQSLVLGYSRS